MKCCQILEIRHKCTEGATLEGKEVKNTFVLTFAFQVVFTGFHALQNLHSSLHDESSLGNICLAIMSGTAIVSSVLSPTIIGLIGAKTSIVAYFAALGIYVLANYYPSFTTMAPAAVAVGAFQGPAWTSQALYISASAFSFSKSSSASPYSILSRFNVFFFSVYATSQIVGNLVTSTVIKDGIGNSSDDSVVFRMCGPDDCPNVKNATVIEDPEDWVIDIILGFFLSCTLAGLLTVVLLLSALPRSEWIQRVSVRSTTTSCFNVLVSTNMILLVPFIFFTAVVNGFLLSVYTKSYVACPIGIHMVGYVMAVYGTTTPVFVFLFNRLSRVAGRFILLILSLITHTVLFIILFVWSPSPGDEAIIFTIPVIWGVAESILQAQANALIAMLFPTQKEPAFANFHAWRSLGYAVTFLNSSYMCVSSKLLVCIAFAGTGTILYILVEIRTKVKEKLALKRPRKSVASVSSESETRQENNRTSLTSNRSSYSSLHSIQDQLSFERIELTDIINEAQEGWKRNENGLTLELNRVMSAEHLAISKVTNWYHTIPVQSDFTNKVTLRELSRPPRLPRSLSDGHLHYAAAKVESALFKVRRGRNNVIRSEKRIQQTAPPLPKRRHFSDINPPNFHVIRDIVYEEDECVVEDKTEIDSEMPDIKNCDNIFKSNYEDNDEDDIDEHEANAIMMDYRNVLRRLSETLNKDSLGNKSRTPNNTEDNMSDVSLSSSLQDVPESQEDVDDDGHNRFERDIKFTLGSTSPSISSRHNRDFESDDADSTGVIHNSLLKNTRPKFYRSVSCETGSGTGYETDESGSVANGVHNSLNTRLTPETTDINERRNAVINLFKKGFRKSRTTSVNEDINSVASSSYNNRGFNGDDEDYSDEDSDGFVNNKHNNYIPNHVNSNETLKRKNRIIPISEEEDITCIY